MSDATNENDESNETIKAPTYKRLPHKYLIDLVRKFAPAISDHGVCNGFSSMWLQAVLTGQLQETAFYKRLDWISKYAIEHNAATNKTAFEALKKEIEEILNQKKNLLEKNPKENKESLIEIRAFCEAVAITQDIEDLKIFQEGITQWDFSKVYPLVRSEALENSQQVIQSSLIGVSVASLSELENYFTELQKILHEASVENANDENSPNSKNGFLISSEWHATAAYFHPTSQKWRFMDVNQLSDKTTYYAEVDSKELASLAFSSHLDNEDEYTALSIRHMVIQSKATQKEVSKAFLRKLRDVPRPLNATKTNSRNINALYIATMYDDTDGIKRLIADGVNINDLNLAHQSALMIAAIYGSVNVGAALLESGAKIDLSDIWKSTALMYAAEHNFLPFVKLLLAANPSLNLEDMKGNSALLIAVKQGHLDIVSALLAAGAGKGFDGSKTLLEAVAHDHDDIVVALLAAMSGLDIDINAENKSGKTAITLAAQHGNLKTFMALKTAGAKVGVLDQENTTLSFLAQTKFIEYELLPIENLPKDSSPEKNKIYLEKAGPQLNYFMLDSQGREVKGTLDISLDAEKLKPELLTEHKIAILTAISKRGHADGKIAICSELLEATPNKEMVNARGDTTFLVAAQHSNAPLLEMLLKAGANPLAVSQYGDTALMLAINRQNSDLKAIELLLNSPIKINAANKSGDTALTLAYKRGNEAIIKLLIEKGATLDQNNPEQLRIQQAYHNTPLSNKLAAAIKLNDMSLFNRLFEKGIKNVNGLDHEGNSALMLAAQSGKVRIVEALMKAGANINLVNHGGNSALMMALEKGHYDVAKDLINANADTHFVNTNGDTALMIGVKALRDKTILFNLLIDLIKNSPVDVVNLQGKTALLLAAEGGFNELTEKLITKTLHGPNNAILCNPELLSLIRANCHKPLVEKFEKLYLRFEKQLKEIAPPPPLILSTPVTLHLSSLPDKNDSQQPISDIPPSITTPKSSPKA